LARELRVSEDVARFLPAPLLAQLHATIDDPDNVCCVCEGLIDGPSAEVVVFTDGQAAALIKVAHSDCMISGVRTLPGLREAFDARAQAAEGFSMATKLGLRKREPRALIFLEHEVLAGGIEEDPLEVYSEALGLAPIAGSIEDIELVETELFTIELIDEGLGLRAAHGLETIPAEAYELARWLEAAEGRGAVIVARGLGLSRPEPTIEEALALRPAWGAVAMIADPGD
jgi:hypothetical protein